MENNRHNSARGHFAESRLFWMILFFSVLTGYCCCYAPYGINETDGGFLTGLAWQLLQGKTLYGEVLYVRPPLPVWLRALELHMLPEQWAILGERWIFYGKIGLYSLLGAAVLTKGARRWMLATFGFVVSVHCYPPMAWHTVDGILFSVAGIWCLTAFTSRWSAVIAGILIFGGLLCKQSFYPMAAVFAGLLLLRPAVHSLKAGGFKPDFPKFALGMSTLFLCIGFFISYLYSNGLLEHYLRLTGSAASGGQALQHGVLDYFRIKPILALGSILLLLPAAWNVWKGKKSRLTIWLWTAWLALMAGSYAWEIWRLQSFTAPFAQSRLLFWTGTVFAITSLPALHSAFRTPHSALRIPHSAFRIPHSVFRTPHSALRTPHPAPRTPHPAFRTPHPAFRIPHSALRTPHSALRIPHSALLSLLVVSWCAAVSWGYNLPILFAAPWLFAVMEISRCLWQRAYPQMHLPGASLLALAALLLVFRLGYEFVYRDGRRSEMRTSLGTIFPALGGIYSTEEKGRFYLDLKTLAARYPNFKTLPAFPQANFLTKTRPPLPLDWVVRRETNGERTLILKNIEENKPVLLVEKTWIEKSQTDPELRLLRDWLRTGTILDETAYFLVVQPNPVAHYE